MSISQAIEKFDLPGSYPLDGKSRELKLDIHLIASSNFLGHFKEMLSVRR